jgi:2,5-dihydroxypyridine 5,6-dioxygenase
MTIQLSDMMPGAMNCMRNSVKIEPGDEVLIICDTTSDRDVTEAYKIAAEIVGGRVSVLTLKSAGAGASSDEITHNALYGLWPKVAFHALTAADWCVNLTAFTDIHGMFGTGADAYGLESMMDIWEKYRTRMLSVVITSKEGLASDWATYPERLLRYLGYKAHEHVLAAAPDTEKALVRVTDLQGTDLSLEGFTMVTKASLDSKGERALPFYTFGTEVVGLKPLPNAEGVIVSTSIHTGWVPEMKMTVKGGKGVQIEGGGEVGILWTRDFEKGKGAESRRRLAIFGEHPGPGVNWLEELMYGVHPKAFRIGYKYRWEGSEAFGAWNGGTRRSGTLHFGFGGGTNEWYRHRDLEVFFPTLTINGETIIENGRLKILDDREVREEAAKYGDPDYLLTEKWIPEMPPRD